MRILVTGAAGFIGMHVARELLKQGAEVTGVDNLTDYYDVRLKEARLAQLWPLPGFRFLKLDLTDHTGVQLLFNEGRFHRVINLAAQAGVRYSAKNPHAYTSSNVVGFLNVLEGCRHHHIEHLVYASSSSVYGSNTKMPFAENDPADHPVSLYAATKRANELMAHSYSSMYGLPTTGLRFFTVYGPWGRPDMSPTLFAEAISAGRPIDVFNEGRMERDFTYIDDIVEGIVRTLDNPAAASGTFDRSRPDPADSDVPYRLFNIGNNRPVKLGVFIAELERALGKTAVKRLLPMQAGDVVATCADIDRLQAAVGFTPATPLSAGLDRFAAWFNGYYRPGGPVVGS